MCWPHLIIIIAIKAIIINLYLYILNSDKNIYKKYYDDNFIVLLTDQYEHNDICKVSALGSPYVLLSAAWLDISGYRPDLPGDEDDKPDGEDDEDGGRYGDQGGDDEKDEG